MKFNSDLKVNKVLLLEDVQNKSITNLEEQIAVDNVATYGTIAKLFALKNLSQFSLCLIERCFTMFIDSHDFYELDYNFVAKILSSSELNIDSELQVFNAADSWLKYDFIERAKFAKNILLKVRFSLLSDHALKNILTKTSSFTCNKDCDKTIEEILHDKNTYMKNKSGSFYKSRYCSQHKFNVILCGGYTNREESSSNTTYNKNVYNIDLQNPDDVTILPEMNEDREKFKMVCVKDEVYVLGGIDENTKRYCCTERYSASTNTWEIVDNMLVDDYGRFCACSFMDNVYVMGDYINRCMVFNKNTQQWNNIANMNDDRIFHAIEIFEGRIVVSGGMGNAGNDLNTVEAYDHVADSWSYMPSMIETRSDHKSVAIRNKLFVIGELDMKCEVFDSTSKKFVYIKKLHPKSFLDDFENRPTEIVSIGSQIVMFADLSRTILLYDVENNEWSIKSCEATKDIQEFSCSKVPQL